MPRITDLFEAHAKNLALLSSNGYHHAGFCVPEYQRPYDWSADNIQRLFFDCLHGFNRLKNEPSSNVFSFLGTLILVKGQRADEPDFKGDSLTIVDGQQRLTTLALLCCALFEELTIRKDALVLDDSRECTWVMEESQYQLQLLRGFAVGRQLLVGDTIFPFPRIVRSEDTRGNSVRSTEYKSPIAQFLDEFARYTLADSTEVKFDPKIRLGVNSPIGKRNTEKLIENFSTLRKLVRTLSDESFYEDTECDFVHSKHFDSRGFMSILPKFDSTYGEENSNQSQRSKGINKIINNSNFNVIHRLLLLSSYITSHVVLTCVETNDESGAFDIFDSLNTTGEPLTAIETLKPQVVKHESKKGQFEKSPSSDSFDEISIHIDGQNKSTEKKQQATKETIITFASYLEGYKLSKELGHQRNYLKDRYNIAIKSSGAGRANAASDFVQAIADTAHFRRYYWKNKDFEELGRFHSQEVLQEVQLCASYISDMNTSLALPIVLRYWSKNLKIKGDAEFIEILKAITAFLTLRRGATGITAGIDAEFRSIMLQPDESYTRRLGLCAGHDHSNPLISAEKLKLGLREFLTDGTTRYSFSGKASWVDKVIKNPLAKQSKPLSRFLILAAADGSSSCNNNPGLWVRDGVKESDDNLTLRYDHWVGDRYATLEHIAPEKASDGSWGDVYDHGVVVDSIGNLTLLPKSENSAINNKGWHKKRLFYKALAARTLDEQRKLIEQAKREDIDIPESTIKILEKQRVLPILDTLTSIDSWSAELVRKRSRNIAELAYDRLWPWLE